MRKLMIAGTILAVITLSGAVCMSAVRGQAGEKDLVREAFLSIAANFWPNYIADKLGFYEQEGIRYEQIIVDPRVAVSVLIGGAVNISYAGATQVVLAVQQGAQIYAVGMSSDRQPYKLMSAAPYKAIADLKGQRISAAVEVDVYTYVLKQILRKGGLNPDKDVEWAFGGSQNQRMVAISGGAVQAGLFSPPGSTWLEKKGFNTLAFTPDFFPELTLSVETVSFEFAQRKNGDVLRRVLRAESKAVNWLNDSQNKTRAMEILASISKIGIEETREAYDYYIGQRIWPDACVHPAGISNVIDIMKQTKQLAPDTKLQTSDFVKTDWCTT
jgi:ABC-type nitrate/sulfonate/bicarbonate transport system substrate-binding protein